MKISTKTTTRLFFVLVVIMMASLIVGISITGYDAYAATVTKTVSTKVMHLSDTHVFPIKYCNPYSADYLAASGEGMKLLEQSEVALETSLQEIYDMGDDAPMYIVTSGDLTSNGEYLANVYVAEIFRQFTQKMRTRTDTTVDFSGFQIFAVPGNHDVYNFNAKTYMPSEEELAACADDDERRELLINYEPTRVRTTTITDIFDIYADFGFCNCPDRKNGHHLSTCGMADGCCLDFFYESKYWYDNNTTRVTQADNTVKYTGFTIGTPTKAELDAFKESDDDFEILAETARLGAFSYVARMGGVTVINVDGNARKYDGRQENAAQISASGWDESTGGVVTRAQLRWLVDETKDDVANDNLVIIGCHYNVVPHFDAEDEVISLFTLDNWEEFTNTMANAGIRYALTGHQHTNDIVDYVTQEGNIFYDTETCSTISYGSSYRTLEYTQTWDKSGTYSEKVTSNIHTLHSNMGTDAFHYGVYKLNSDITADDTVCTDMISEIFEANDIAWQVDLYNGGYMSMVAAVCKDSEGNEVGIDDYLALEMANMLPTMISGMVNDGLYDTLRGAVDGLNDFKYVKRIAGALIDGLEELNLYKFNASADGKNFSMSKNPVDGYDLIDVANDMIDYFLEYDFSYGTIKGGFTLSDLLVDIYGGHLTGAGTDKMSPCLTELIKKLYDGTFVEFLVGTLLDTVMPELDLIFDAPIRFNTRTPVLAEGKGFDISAVVDGAASTGVDNFVKVLLNNYCFKSLDSKGYSSLKFLLKDIAAIAEDILITDTASIKDSTLKLLAGVVRPILEGFGDIGGYVDMAMGYLNQYFTVGTLYEVLDDALLSKYLTKAFCCNLGDYAAYLVLSFNVDDVPDGSYWDPNIDKMKAFATKNTPNFNITTNKSNGKTAYKNFAYFRTADGKSALEVVPSSENGLLASMATVSFNDDIYTEKKIQWFTSIETNVFDKNAAGEYEYSVPDSYIKYSTSEDMSNAVTVKATSVNVDRELPTIDLGILYFNMNHRYKLYNQHTVCLKELKDGTTYYYQLGSDKYGWTTVNKFATAAKSGGFSFTAITDIQGSVENNYINSLPSLTKAVGEGTDFIVTCGDNVDNGKNIMQYTWWLDRQSSIWRNNTMVSLAGNHEDANYSLSSIIAIPDKATVNATGYYYSYDYQNTHFIVVDTNDLKSDNNLSDKQTEWLTADLEANKANKETKWTIVMLHKGPYTAGSHAFDEDVTVLRAQLTPLFADYGVDVVLQGHDHTYSVSEYIGRDGTPVTATYDKDGYAKDPDGVLYINLGTIGDKYYSYIYNDAVSLVKRTSVSEGLEKYFVDGNLELTETPVYANISVEKNKLTIKTYTIVDDNVILVDDIGLAKAAGFDWSNLTTGQIVGIVAIAFSVTAIIILGVVLGYTRKKRISKAV